MLSVRQVEPADREMLDLAASQDFYHSAAGLTGEHWAKGNSLVYSDDHGYVVALKTTQVARVDIQFLTEDKQRSARALIQGFWGYVEVLRQRGIEEIVFNSNSVGVINFFQRAFHFRHLGGDEYSLRIK